MVLVHNLSSYIFDKKHNLYYFQAFEVNSSTRTDILVNKISHRLKLR